MSFCFKAYLFDPFHKFFPAGWPFRVKLLNVESLDFNSTSNYFPQKIFNCSKKILYCKPKHYSNVILSSSLTLQSCFQIKTIFTLNDKKRLKIRYFRYLNFLAVRLFVYNYIGFLTNELDKGVNKKASKFVLFVYKVIKLTTNIHWRAMTTILSFLEYIYQMHVNNTYEKQVLLHCMLQ